MKRINKIIAIVLAVCLLLGSAALAHGGRTDSSGGHKDNKNASGLGGYHYHHGYPAHLHENGVCPYEDAPSEEESEPAAAKAPKPAAAPEPPQAPGGVLTVHFIDVGQADSILIQMPSGRVMMIDAGNNGDGGALKKYLQALNVKRIDVLVGTHPHEDHIGGLDDIIKAFDIGSVYMPKVSATSKTYEDVLSAIKSKGLKVNTAKAGAEIKLGGESALSIEMIAPNGAEYDSLNDYSAAIKLTYGSTKMLFMGDVEEVSEKEILKAKYDIKAELIKVGHHGSDTATSAAFLKAVAPKLAVISCGEDNSYGHPHKEVLARLKSQKADVYRTDTMGTIVAFSDGKKITVK